jgi:hypothetical protein
LEPVLSPRAAAKLVEDVRQLKEDAAKSQEQIRQLELRIAELERQLPAKQGAQPREVGAFPTMGTLVLDNRTLFAHTVSVNGLLISVAPGRTTIDIPVGTATVYMPYHERPKQFGLDRWHRSGQHYEMLITINDQ